MISVLVSIVVSIPACHAGDPGSIPGRGDFFSCLPPGSRDFAIGSNSLANVYTPRSFDILQIKYHVYDSYSTPYK